MTDYIQIIINAAATGIGVAVGNELYDWFKKRRKKIKLKPFNSLSLINNHKTIETFK